MTEGFVPEPVPRLGVADLLQRARFEVVPLRGVEEEVAALPAGTTVTVTCSPRKGVDATVEVAVRLAEQGFRTVPHVAARGVHSRGHLERIVGRLRTAGVDEAFVIGGDALAPEGPYASAGELLRDLAEVGNPFHDVGIAGYPERHPLIERDELYRALLDKQPMASYVVTQICFDPAAIFGWLLQIRERGVSLPVHIGMPGVVSRRRLLEIGLRIGVGDSLRYARKHGGLVARLVGGGFRPDPFLARLSPYLAEPGHNVRGFHVNTFNHVRATERWRRRALAAYG